MTDLVIPPPEDTTADQIRVGDYLTSLNGQEFLPEQRVQTLHRPLLWDGRRAGLWGFGFADGTAISVSGEGHQIPAARLAPTEADLRDRMHHTIRRTPRPAGEPEPQPTRLII